MAKDVPSVAQQIVLAKMRSLYTLMETVTGYKLRRAVGFAKDGREIFRYEHVNRRTVEAMIRAGLVWYEAPDDPDNKFLRCA
ncbi:MAG: hypothetical protein FOGNACKC_00873 [Anaerolineae bacterium]|nr:hypothetical protein [Anaerolineae bacterium]